MTLRVKEENPALLRKTKPPALASSAEIRSIQPRTFLSYEWRRESKRKMPMWITLKSREPFAFPGLWDCWVDRDTGSQLYSFTIITTRANGLLRPIHDRMPVIYDAAMGRQWLDGPFGGRAMGLDLVLQPIPSERMQAHEVSTLVNSPENDMAACIQPASPGQPIKSHLPLL
jgi:putative SOS response-associated peptidase YedK